MAALLAAPACARRRPPLILGATTAARPGQSSQQAVEALEGKLGRRLGAIREFRRWHSAFPTSYDRWLRDTGHLIVLSVKPLRADGTIVRWREIADARPGSPLHQEIVGWARKVASHGAPIEFTFHHEPEASTNVAYGTSADFVAAWRKVVDTFRASGVRNARYLWVMTDYGFAWPPTERRHAPKWYPGDAWVDDMGVDPYNWHECRPGNPAPWQPSLAASIEPFVRWARQHPTKGLWLAEWASTEYPGDPRRKAAWIRESAALLKQPAYAQFRGLTYFDYVDPGNQPCAWRLDSSPQSLAAFKAMAADPAYQGTRTGR